MCNYTSTPLTIYHTCIRRRRVPTENFIDNSNCLQKLLSFLETLICKRISITFDLILRHAPYSFSMSFFTKLIFCWASEGTWKFYLKRFCYDQDSYTVRCMEVAHIWARIRCSCKYALNVSDERSPCFIHFFL